MAKRPIRGEPYKYEPYQANDASRRQYAPTDHTYVIWWYSDPDHDKRVQSLLASIGISTKIGTDGTLRIGYRLLSRKNIKEVTRVLREGLIPGVKSKSRRGSQDSAFHQLDFSIREEGT